MESIQETSMKRRKLNREDGWKGYNLQVNNGEDTFETYQTTDTVPLTQKPTQQPSTLTPRQNATQLTQVVHKDLLPGSHSGKESVVQVSASSPAAPPYVSSYPPTPAKSISLLAGSMAPAGTTFRPPAGVVKVPVGPMLKGKTVVNLNEYNDSPLYKEGSSDDDSQICNADIKPSSFVTQAPRMGNKSKGPDCFKEITSKAIYNPFNKKATCPISSSDVLANAYGSGRNKPIREAYLDVSARVIPFEVKTKPVEDINITDIQDEQLRTKIKRVLEVLPGTSVLSARNALIKKKANYDDAMDYLAAQDEKAVHIDLTLEERTQKGQTPLPKKPSVKQQIKAPILKIQEKWSSAHSVPHSVRSPSLVRRVPTAKPCRRLVQGRQHDSSYDALPSMKAPRPVTPRSAGPELGEYDSALGEDINESTVGAKVLKFFNSCSIAHLADIAAIPEVVAAMVLSQRPFSSLDNVRQISCNPPSAAGRRGYTRKAVGDKIVGKCLNMWNGYEAVDKLVRHCEDLSKPLKRVMADWGIDLCGSANGEVELADLDSSSKGATDSGIGTPRSRSVSADEDVDGNVLKFPNRKHCFFPQPSLLARDITLKEYQIVGVNWLSLLFYQGLSCILADDMGLGKTCQVIAFLAHLSEKGIKGPHLIIVPGSTLENWLREFSVFCPKLRVEPYYGSQKDRAEIRDSIQANAKHINVIITTYDLASKRDDNRFLRRLKPVCCIYDEGHFLRNNASARYEAFMRISAQFRLLLTGTPLQNNLQELVSLLGFILPSVFREHTDDLQAIFSHKAKTTNNSDSHAALLSTQRIARAKSMMAPFVLRRKKHQVLKQLPNKHNKVEICELSLSQAEIYEQEKARVLRIYCAREAGEKTDVSKESTNIMMRLRQASIHPLLFRRNFSDGKVKEMSHACLKEDQFRGSNPDLVLEEMLAYSDWELHSFCERYPSTMSPFLLKNKEWMDSGKVRTLSTLLEQYRKNGDRALIFSQFIMVHDILEVVLETLGVRFFRLDGSTKMDERQTMIDEFYSDPKITAFLLSTKAGGAGINLACANKVRVLRTFLVVMIAIP